MFEAEGFYSVCKKAVKKLILPLVAEIKEHITNERITLMGQFDASNERLTKAVTDQLRQTSEALQRLVDSDAEKEQLKAEVQAQVTMLDQFSADLESDDPVPAPVEPAPPVEEPVPAPPVEEPFNPAPVEPDAGFDTNMPVVNEPVEPVLGEPAPGTEPAPAPVDEGSNTEVPDPNGPSASR